MRPPRYTTARYPVVRAILWIVLALLAFVSTTNSTPMAATSAVLSFAVVSLLLFSRGPETNRTQDDAAFIVERLREPAWHALVTRGRLPGARIEPTPPTDELAPESVDAARVGSNESSPPSAEEERARGDGRSVQAAGPEVTSPEGYAAAAAAQASTRASTSSPRWSDLAVLEQSREAEFDGGVIDVRAVLVELAELRGKVARAGELASIDRTLAESPVPQAGAVPDAGREHRKLERRVADLRVERAELQAKVEVLTELVEVLRANLEDLRRKRTVAGQEQDRRATGELT